MKNIQEIILKCGGKGKLKLGDEEIDVYVSSVKTKTKQLDGYTDCHLNYHTGKHFIATKLTCDVYGDKFSGLDRRKNESISR